MIVTSFRAIQPIEKSKMNFQINQRCESLIDKEPEWADFVVRKERERKRLIDYAVEIENNKKGYEKKYHAIKDIYFGKYIEFCNGNVIGSSDSHEEIEKYSQSEPSVFITMVGYDYMRNQ